MRITRIAAVAAVVATALVATAMPASAHHLLGAFTGTAITTGTWAPASPACGSTPCPAGNSWSFSSTTDVIAPDNPASVGSGRISGSGTFTGWCGRSQGAGNFTLGIDSGTVTWESAGTIIVLTGSGPGHTAAAAVVAARAAAGTGNCVTAPATAFDVVGVAVIA